MGWSLGFDTRWARDIGYGVPAICDHPRCSAEIDRGLGHVCGGEPYGGDKGCGLYFCGEHLTVAPQLCPKCARYDHKPYQPKPDCREWVEFKLTDPSWEQWRAEHPAEVARMKGRVYVDALFTAVSREPEAARVGRRNADQWCHLWTDPGNEEVLHTLAQSIGLRREWFQPKEGFPHYDCTPGRRRRAIAAGAVETDLREWLRKRKATDYPAGWKETCRHAGLTDVMRPSAVSGRSTP